MTLEEYIAQKKTDPKEYADCVIHESDWPAIAAWGKRQKGRFSLPHGTMDRTPFYNGAFNMIRLSADGSFSSFLCNGEKSSVQMVKLAERIFDGFMGTGLTNPLFLNPYKLGILSKPPPDLEF